MQTVFTQVYDKSRELIGARCLEKRWPETQLRLQAFFNADGPNPDQASVLDLVRTELNMGDAFWTGDKKGKLQSSPGASAAAIFAIAQASANPSAKLEEIVSLLKMLKHLYFVSVSGSQSIWVADGPKVYDMWVYDMFGGKSEQKIKELLLQEDEFFGEDNRKFASDSFRQGKKITADILIKLDKPDANTLSTAKKWFLADAANDRDVAALIDLLRDGFKKIAALFNSTTVIFCDDAPERKDLDDATAAIKWVGRPGNYERLLAVYISSVFKKSAKGKTFWKVALAIMHEFSHRALGLRDIKSNGKIKPGFDLFEEEAQGNARNWEMFAGDLLGIIPTEILANFSR